jgi:hypothetical protein
MAGPAHFRGLENSRVIRLRRPALCKALHPAEKTGILVARFLFILGPSDIRAFEVMLIPARRNFRDLLHREFKFLEGLFATEAVEKRDDVSGRTVRSPQDALSRPRRRSWSCLGSG